MKNENCQHIRYSIYHSRHKKDLKDALICARVTVNKKRIEISLKGRIDPLTWDYLRRMPERRGSYDVIEIYDVTGMYEVGS